MILYIVQDVSTRYNYGIECQGLYVDLDTLIISEPIGLFLDEDPSSIRLIEVKIC